MNKHEDYIENIETFMFDLLLLCYPLLLMAGGTIINPHYLIIVIALIAGAILYFLRLNNHYSIIACVILSVILTVPFLLTGMPFIACMFIFAYIAWRFHGSIGLKRRVRWGFLLVNLVMFTICYLFAQIYFLKPYIIKVNTAFIYLFLLTNILFLFLRSIRVLIAGKRNINFKASAMAKLFFTTLGLGSAAGIILFFSLEKIRNLFIRIFSMTVGSLFYKAAEFFPDSIEQFEIDLPTSEPEQQIGFEGFEEYPSDSNIGIYIMIIGALLLVVLAVIIYFLKSQANIVAPRALFEMRSKGIAIQQSNENQPSGYNYSIAEDEIRKAYLEFEKDAEKADCARLPYETTREWFARMGWQEKEVIFNTYFKTRFGESAITIEEQRRFKSELEKIKSNFFKKDV